VKWGHCKILDRALLRREGGEFQRLTNKCVCFYYSIDLNSSASESVQLLEAGSLKTPEKVKTDTSTQKMGTTQQLHTATSKIQEEAGGFALPRVTGVTQPHLCLT
jgi:hypothetical protein